MKVDSKVSQVSANLVVGLCYLIIKKDEYM